MTTSPRPRKSLRPLPAQIAAKAERKHDARRQPEPGLYFGLGMFGLVGWSVAIPTVLGIALGLWIDTRWQTRFSWTLMLMVLGVALGCFNAWRWVDQANRERHSMKKKEDSPLDD